MTIFGKTGRRRLVAATAAAIVAAGAIYFWRMASAIEVQAAQIETNVPVRVFGIGNVEAQILSRVGFQVAGKIVSVNADQGDFVARGALLAKLDDATQRAKLAKSEAALRQAEANQAKVQALRDRAEVQAQQKRNVNVRRQSLAVRGTISQEAAEDAQAAEEIAGSDLRVAQADAAVAAVLRDDAAAQWQYESVLLGQHELRAPFDARVIARSKEPGAVAATGEPVFTLIAPDSVWVRAFIDEASAGGIAVGQRAFVRLRSEADRLYAAEVVRIDQESDRVTEERRVYVRCSECGTQHPLRFLGEQAEIEIEKRIVPGGRFVPLNAVEGYDGRSGLVWTVENGRLARKRIALGDRLLDGRVEVAPDLPASVAVVTINAAGLREGRAARIASSGS